MISCSYGNRNDNVFNVPSFHRVNNASVVPVTIHSALELIEEIAELHADDEACHAQKDVTPHLQTQSHTPFFI